jgi:hypothetical protein
VIRGAETERTQEVVTMWAVRSLAVAVVVLAAFGCSTTGGGAADSGPGLDAESERHLRAMSDLLARTSALSYTTTQVFERVRRSGERVTELTTRQVVLRRPDGLWVGTRGDGRDGGLWYDGKTIAVQSNPRKVYALAPVQATLDQLIDYVGERLSVPLPTADLLYSSPYDSYVGRSTRGRYQGRADVEGVACHRLAFEDEAVDWKICIEDGARPLPRQLEIVYRTHQGEPRVTVTFTDWSLAPAIAADAFTFRVPEGYERIRLVHLARPGAAGAPAGGPATK